MIDIFGLKPNPKATATLMRLYTVVGKEITQELFRINVGNYTELLAISVQENVNKIVKKLNRLSIRWSNDSVKDTYKDGFIKSSDALTRFGADKDPTFDNSAHRLTVDKYTDLTAEDLVKANQSIKLNVSTYLVLLKKAHDSMAHIQAFDLRDEEVIANLLDDAIREGASRGKLEQLIRVHFRRELYERKFININGRNYDMIKYARTVARTRLRQVQSESVKNTCIQYENDLVEISDHGTTTESCIPYERNIFSISGKHPTYSLLDTWPPFHPNCLLPGPQIKSSGGIIAGMRARYNGKAVKVTLTNGSNVSVTVNHLFLTPKGFAPAHLLRKGDDIFYCPDF